MNKIYIFGEEDKPRWDVKIDLGVLFNKGFSVFVLLPGRYGVPQFEGNH